MAEQPLADPPPARLDRTALVAFVVTAAVFAPVLANGFVAWDDLRFIATNPRLNPPTWANTLWYWRHAAWNLYQPMNMTLWAACARAGWVETPDPTAGHMNPAVFHLASVLLHALSAAGAFVILKRATRGNGRLALIGTLLFALHPVQVEAIAFAGASNNPLFGCLGLAAVIAYLQWTDPAGPRSPWLAVLSCVLLLLSMFSKPTAVVLVPTAWILDGLVNGRPFRQRTRSILPWAILAVPCVMWTRSAQHGSEWAGLPFPQRALVAADAVAFHLRNIALPTRLAIDYGHTPTAVLNRSAVELAIAVAVAAACLALVAILHRRAPLASAGIAIFLVGLLPNSGLVPFDSQMVSTVSDRYAYLPMLGVAMVALAALALLTPRRQWVVGGVLVVPLILVTEFQIQTWRDSESLFHRALDVNPKSWMARTNLAFVVGDRDPDAAIRLCRESIELRPNQPIAWNTLGSVLMAIGHKSEGARALAEAHRMQPDDPLFAANAARAAREVAH